MDLLSPDQRSRVEHVACDFLSKPEDIAKQLKDKNVTADYVFFCACHVRAYTEVLTNVDVERLLCPAQA